MKIKSSALVEYSNNSKGQKDYYGNDLLETLIEFKIVGKGYGSNPCIELIIDEKRRTPTRLQTKTICTIIPKSTVLALRAALNTVKF